MRATRFVFALLLFLTKTALAQQKALEVEWETTFGDSSVNFAFSIIQTNDGGYAVCGNKQSDSDLKEGFWVIKLNNRGNIEWEKIFGGSKTDGASSIIQTKDGGYAVCGVKWSDGVWNGDFWIIKLNKQGTIEWEKSFGGTENDYAFSIIQTVDGGYAVCGGTESKGAEEYDFWVIKLNKQGAVEWEKIFGGSGIDFAFSIIQTNDGGYAICGSKSDKSWIIKLNNRGTIEWEKTYRGLVTDIASSIIQTNDGGYAVCGYIESKSADKEDFWIIKLNNKGAIEWEKTFGGSESDKASSIIQTKSGGYAVFGSTASKGNGKDDSWVIKLNNQGTVEWEITFGGSESDKARSIIQTIDSGYAVCGYTITRSWVIKFKKEPPKILAPPILITKDITFKEPSENNAIDANEDGQISFTLENRGKGNAYSLKAYINNLGTEKNIDFDNEIEIGDIKPNEIKTVTIDLKGNENVKTSEVKLAVSFLEANGFEPDDINITFNTKAFDPPVLTVANTSISDDGTGESHGNSNNQIEYAEIIEVTSFIQNQGLGDAENVNVEVLVNDRNIFVLSEQSRFNFAKIQAGNYKQIKFLFTVNKRFKGTKLPIILNITESRGKYGKTEDLGLQMNQVTMAAKNIKIASRIEDKKVIFKDVPNLTVDVDINIPKTTMINKDGIAVVFGNRDYQKTREVTFAIHDARVIRNYLIKTLGFKEGNIFFIENATQSDFRTYFGIAGNHKGKLFNAVKKNKSDVFIYYSGHGAPGLKSHKGYFVPVECDPQYVELGGYALDTFYENIAKIPANSITVVLDACFSGATIFSGVSPLVIKIDKPTMTLTNGITLASSSGDQVSSWFNDKKHGMFTYLFLKAIHNKNADFNNDNKLTFTEIYKYIADESEGVPYYARRIHGVEQNPTIEGKNKDRVYVRYGY